MSLEQSIYNCIFRGVITDGTIYVTNYQGIDGTGITMNSLKGMIVVANGLPVGYVLSNSAWFDGGLTAVMGYNHTTIDGMAEIALVFPVGRLSIVNAAVSTKSQPKLLMEHSIPISMAAQPALPSLFSFQVMLRTSRNSTVSGFMTQKLRGGVYVTRY